MKGCFYENFRIKKDINQLSVQDHASLAQWIIQNLDDIEDDEHAVDAEWRREVRTRVNDIRNGKVKMIPSEEIWGNLLSRYYERRSRISSGSPGRNIQYIELL